MLCLGSFKLQADAWCSSSGFQTQTLRGCMSVTDNQEVNGYFVLCFGSKQGRPKNLTGGCPCFAQKDLMVICWKNRGKEARCCVFLQKIYGYRCSQRSVKLRVVWVSLVISVTCKGNKQTEILHCIITFEIDHRTNLTWQSYELLHRRGYFRICRWVRFMEFPGIHVETFQHLVEGNCTVKSSLSMIATHNFTKRK